MAESGSSLPEVPELKVPEDHSLLESWTAAEYGGEDSFPAFYQKIVKQAHGHHGVSVTYSYAPGYEKYKRLSSTDEEICKSLNDRDAYIRAEVASEIQRYLIEHGGRVDAWPDSAGQVVSSGGPGLESLKATFDYFGADYYSPERRVIRRTKKAPVYYNAYKFPGTSEFKEWKQAEKDVKADRNERNSQIWLLFWTVVAGLCSLYVSLSLLTSLLIPSVGKYFLIWKQTFSDFANGSLWLEILSLLNSILMFPATLLAVLNDELGFFWIPGLLMLGLGVYAIVWCIGQVKEERKKISSNHYDYKQHKEILRGDGKRIAEENDRLRREYEEFAEKWHRAWFEWVRTHKETSA